MTKHTYFRADDGTLFIPEPQDSTIEFCTNNAMAYDACLKCDAKSPSAILSRRIVDCGLSVSALNALKALGVKIVQDLGNHCKADVLQMHNVCPKNFAEINDFMISHNLKWKEV